MRNQAMLRKLEKNEAADVRTVGEELAPGVFRLQAFTEGIDYCDAEKEDWIWSIGKDLRDGTILASTDARFFRNPDFDCLFLR
jgi:hypothetical protein